VVSAIIVDYRQQTFNDALYFLGQALKITNPLSQPFEYWKNCTYSIISATLCMEAYMTMENNAIREQKNKSMWEACDKQLKGYSNGIRRKIRFLECFYNIKIMDFQDPSWMNICSIIKLRNDIMHLNRMSIFNSITLINAQNAIKACRDLIKKFHHETGTIPPKWIDKSISENYDKPK
jgi:hypothetical protein